MPSERRLNRCGRSSGVSQHPMVTVSPMQRTRTLLTSTVGLGLPILLVTAACGDDRQTRSTAISMNTTAATTTAVPTTSSPGTATSAPGTASVPPDTTSTPVIDPGDGGNYHPDIDPTEFVDTIDNPYMPLAVGSSWIYEGGDGEEIEDVEVVVTDQRKRVMGIDATVVRDTVHIDGELVEDTYDWFAQDREGNVWYLGETVKNYENGRLADTEGSWEAGVDGALPGIVMPAAPRVGMAYRQEFWEGEAEDLGEIKEVGGTQEVPAGRFDDVLTTTDWNPLEPAVIEEKQYAPGVGLIREQKVAGERGLVELVEFSPPLVSARFSR